MLLHRRVSAIDLEKGTDGMVSEAILAIVEALSEKIVICEPGDLQDLAFMHTDIGELAAWAQAAGLPTTSSALAKSGTLIEQIILEEAEDPAASIALVGDTLAVVQSVVRDHRPEGAVAYPKALGLAVPPGTASGLVLPQQVDAAIFSDFLGRQAGEIDELEAHILGIEGGGSAALEEFKRRIHTLKGESAMLGLEDVERLCHATEDALQSHDPLLLTDGLLALKDWLTQYFEALQGKEAMPAEVSSVLAKLAPAAGGAGAQQTGAKVLEGDLELIGDFVIEATEHLENADVYLLTLESSPYDEEAINAVFRAFHTIKGVCGFIGLDEIKTLAHESESLLDQARKGNVSLTGPAIDVVFEAVDQLKRMVEAVRGALATQAPLPPSETMPALVERIKRVAKGEGAGWSERGVGRERIVSNQPLGEIMIERGSTTKADVDRALRRQAEAEESKKLGEMLIERAIVSRKQVEAALAAQASSEAPGRFGDILAEMGAASLEDIENVASIQSEGVGKPKVGELLVRSGTASAHDVAQALRAQRAMDPDKDQRSSASVQVREAVKVDADRLDRLVDTVGELVIAESMVVQSKELRVAASADLARHLSQLDKITRELQEMSMSLRMVPVRATFQKMARLVRDLAKRTGKTVALHMTGEETELDKSVVDKIGDPLVHMVRNSIDHGLEATAAERAAAGKPETGNVYLRAYHKGGSINIEIEDDGRGLDREAIVRKALERGLIKDPGSLGEREVWNLIFEPGFSTAAKLTEVSGRGVGMDVVKRNIESLRGQIDIVAQAGRGTKFTIRLPLTLAIIDGMVVRVGMHRYILPTLSIVISVRPEAKDLSTVADRSTLLRLQKELLPLHRLGDLFDIEADSRNPAEGTVVVVENEGRKMALLIDEILGQQQIVIKPLGEALRGIPGIAGGAILPDGRIGLIVDIAGLVRITGSEAA